MRIQRLCFACMILVASVSTSGTAQMGRDPTPHRDAMAKASFLVGEWVGNGWLLMPGGRQEIQQSESVRYELGGTILVIEGTARTRTGDQVGDVMFNAYAIVTWSEADGYRMRSYLWNGLVDERSITFGDNGFTWKRETSGGPVTYTMEITEEGDWYESGQMEREGRTFPVIEFRVSPTGNR